MRAYGGAHLEKKRGLTPVSELDEHGIKDRRDYDYRNPFKRDDWTEQPWSAYDPTRDTSQPSSMLTPPPQRYDLPQQWDERLGRPTYLPNVSYG